jgi:hypothetical protein
MSLSTLLTELDVRIILFLEHGSLDKMSKVSKYYREVTEPLLYCHLRLNHMAYHKIKRLCCTLLKRLELAAYPRSFELYARHRILRTDPRPEKFAQELLEILPIMQERSRTLLGKDSPSSVHAEWIASLFLHPPHSDGFLAIIFSMATSLETLMLDRSNILQMTFKAMSLHCVQGVDGVAEDAIRLSSPAFTKLHLLRVQSGDGYVIPVVPSPETLKLQTSKLDGIQWPVTHPGPSPLRTIDIRHGYMLEGSLIQGLRSGYLRPDLT